MSSIKKTTKATKSPAPATKEKAATKPAAKKSAAKATLTKSEAATAAIVAAVTRVAAPAISEAPAKPVAAVKETPKAVTTIITAKIDVGFGNSLFLRGEGAGLSWDRGVAMTNIGSDTWQVTLGESARPFVFKFLVNDLTWSTGEDFTAASGSRLIFVPSF